MHVILTFVFQNVMIPAIVLSVQQEKFAMVLLVKPVRCFDLTRKILAVS